MKFELQGTGPTCIYNIEPYKRNNNYRARVFKEVSLRNQTHYRPVWMFPAHKQVSIIPDLEVSWDCNVFKSGWIQLTFSIENRISRCTDLIFKKLFSSPSAYGLQRVSESFLAVSVNSKKYSGNQTTRLSKHILDWHGCLFEYLPLPLSSIYSLMNYRSAFSRILINSISTSQSCSPASAHT